MRIKILERTAMSDEQRRLVDRAEATGGIRGGPFHAYIHLPKLFEAQQALRNATVSEPLSERERKFVHLAVTRFWNARYPWSVQVRGASEAGIGRDVIDAINEGRTPDIAEPRERACYQVAVELLATKGLAEASYQAAEAVLEVTGLVAAVALVGGFSMTCMTANAFDLDPPAEAPIPLL
jgi:4-carboxymuconolactone decarboxylase